MKKASITGSNISKPATTLLRGKDIAVKGTAILDLNGKTISQEKACTESYEMINNKGNLTITGNGNGNLYLYNGAGIRNACGQVAGVPNKPLSEAARIGISANEKEEIISEDDSMFGEADFDVIFSDSNGYFIRSVYDAEDEGHEHKLYINSWGHEDARYPRVKTVSVKNSDIINNIFLFLIFVLSPPNTNLFLAMCM